MHANCRVGRDDFLEFLLSEIFWNSSFQKFWFQRILEFKIWDFLKLVSEFGFCPIEYVVLLDNKFLDGFSACLHPQPLRLLGGGGGKKTQDQLDRQSCLTLHLYFPQMTPKTAKRKLKEVQNIDFSISKIQRIWTTSAVTVQTHSGHCGYSDEGKKRVIKLVCGSSQLQKDVTRANWHSPQAAVYVYNEEEKGNLHVTTVQTWLHKAGFNWRVRCRGPGVTEVNHVASLAVRELH